MAVGIPSNKKNSNGQGYSIIYEGKKSEIDIVSRNIKDFLPSIKYSNKPNRLYFGDNIDVLATLLQDNGVKGKVKLVYIDPPFATASGFQSRKLDHAYNDHLTGRHFIEFLRERIILIRELLSDDGSFYLHLDERMAFTFKVILDEIFGEKNFRNFIVRKKCNPKNYTNKRFGNVSDYILFYTKTDNYTWNRPYEDWDENRINKEYQYIDEATGKRYKRVPIHAPGKRNGATGGEWHGMMPPPGKHWQYLPSTLDAMNARGEIYWSSNGNPRRKVFLENSNGIPVQDIWLDFKDAHNQNIQITGYPTEKNHLLLERIILASSNPNDIVLDCFSGSGTTLVESSKHFRRWIGADNSPESIKTILKRFTHGTNPMGDFVNKLNVNSSELELFQINDFSLFYDSEIAEGINEFLDIDVQDTSMCPEQLYTLGTSANNK